MFTEIDSSHIKNLVDSESKDFVDEINQKLKKWPFWPLSFLLLAIPVAGIFLAVATAVCIYFFIDIKRKTTVVLYNLDNEAKEKISQFHIAFNELVICSHAWHLSAYTTKHDKKYNAGAASVVKRTGITIKYQAPPYVKTNVQIPRIPVGKQTLYFFPDGLLILEGRRVGFLSYESIKIEQTNQRFIEDERQSKDGQLVDHTWKYVNKSGAPDRRFKDNPRLPIFLYSELHFTSRTGLNEMIQLSRANAGCRLVSMLQLFQ